MTILLNAQKSNFISSFLSFLSIKNHKNFLRKRLEITKFNSLKIERS